MQAQHSKSWYHYPFVWMLFGLPATAVVAGIITLALAVHTDDGLVSDDYYQRGKEINQDLRRDTTAAKINQSAQIMLGTDQRSLRILLAQKAAGPLQLKLSHPTRAGLDQTALLVEQGPQMLFATLPNALEQSTWYVEISDMAGQWRLRGLWKIQPDKAFELRPATH